MPDPNIARKPDIEFRRRIGSGAYRTYGHIYWRPLMLVVLGRVLLGRKRLRRSWKEQA
jgi:hypothetical protein